jgi:hypothetical protein
MPSSATTGGSTATSCAASSIEADGSNPWHPAHRHRHLIARGVVRVPHQDETGGNEAGPASAAATLPGALTRPAPFKYSLPHLQIYLKHIAPLVRREAHGKIPRTGGWRKQSSRTNGVIAGTTVRGEISCLIAFQAQACLRISLKQHRGNTPSTSLSPCSSHADLPQAAQASRPSKPAMPRDTPIVAPPLTAQPSFKNSLSDCPRRTAVPDPAPPA